MWFSRTFKVWCKMTELLLVLGKRFWKHAGLQKVCLGCAATCSSLVQREWMELQLSSV